jgi:hypothetical protein
VTAAPNECRSTSYRCSPFEAPLIEHTIYAGQGSEKDGTRRRRPFRIGRLLDQTQLRAPEAEQNTGLQQENTWQNQEGQQGQSVEGWLADANNEGGCEDQDLECFAGSHDPDVCGASHICHRRGNHGNRTVRDIGFRVFRGQQKARRQADGLG